MSETDPMNIDERRKYLQRMWERYHYASKGDKTMLLDEMEAVTGMHRKSIIRLMQGRRGRKKRERERGKEYGSEVEDAIRVIARSLDYPCAERLQPYLVRMAVQLSAHGELVVTSKTLEALGRISISTVKRMLRRIGPKTEKIASIQPKRPRGNSLRRQYPMSRIAWDIAEAGHLEVDLVHHCGASVRGEYIYTLQWVDVASGWCEIFPIFGRGFLVMRDAFEYLHQRIPFPVIEFHPDNGDEFFNQFLLRYFEDKLPEVHISRSRPYQKNDNRKVEENNHSLVRAYLGDARYDTVSQLAVLRQLHQKLWLYHNFFQPMMKVKAKEYVEPLKYRRKFDTAQTPFDRLVQMECLGEATQTELENLRQSIDPLALRDEIEQLIMELSVLPCAEPGAKINVYDTLIMKEEAAELQ